jgi:hypothetical protein
MEPTATATGPTATKSRFPNLDSLVGTQASARFLDTAFGQDAYRARVSEDWARELFGWPVLNQVLSAHRLGPPRLKLEKHGKQMGRSAFRDRRTRRGETLKDIDVAALYAQLREGATLILDAVNELSPPLQRLCAGLADEFSASCQTNLYACWGATQGFDVHWDDHDVFVVQVEGTKRWALYGPTRAHPLRKDVSGEHRRPEQPIEEVVLGPGDMLYLPRGYWHAAVGMDIPSLHLTIGLSRRTGVDFLHWLADQTVGAAEVRADMPFEQDDAALGDHVAEVLRQALQDLDAAELGKRYRLSVEAGRTHRPQLSFPFIGAEAQALAPSAVVRVTDGGVRLETDGAGPIVLTHRGVRYTLTPSLERPLALLAAGRPLTLEQVAAMSGEPPELVHDLARDLLQRGVLSVSEHP